MTTGRINQGTTRRWSAELLNAALLHQSSELTDQSYSNKWFHKDWLTIMNRTTTTWKNHEVVAALFYFAASLEALSQWTPIRKIQPNEWDSNRSEQWVRKNSVLKYLLTSMWAGTIQQLNSKQSSITVDSYTQQYTDGWHKCLHKYRTGDGDAFTNQREATKLHKA
jgi:hypothetical protein